MTTRKRIDVAFTGDEYAFLKWFAKRDGVSVAEELRMMFYTEFEECRRLYADEMSAE